MKIRAGDHVVIISGKDKGKTGQVLKVLESAHRLIVADANMRTRHIRKTPQRAGEIIKYEASLHMSKVMLIDPKTKKRTRVGFTVDEKGKKTRIAKRSGEAVTAAALAPKQAKGTSKATAPEKKEAPKKAALKPEKKPFWQRIGFGTDALEEASEVPEEARMKQDQSVPGQVQRQSNRGSTRGS